MSLLNIALLTPKPLAVAAAIINALAVLLRPGARTRGADMPKPFPFFGE